MSSKKLIGILEMGKNSTQFYIQLLTQFYGNGKTINSPPYKLVSTDFEAINNLLPNRSPKLDQIIAKYLQAMLLEDVESILIPNITIHETVDAVWSSLDAKISIAHPILGTIKRLHQSKRSEAVLFGTAYTMNSQYIRSTFKNANIALEKPKLKDLKLIDKVRRQVYAGSASMEILNQFNDLVLSYSNETSVILGCTELSIASKIINDRILDMATIQIEEAISMSIK